MTKKDRIDEFVDNNWDHYKTWLAEYIGYAGGLDWDTAETKYEYCLEEGVEL